MSGPSKKPLVPPRWFVRSFWAGHRLVYRFTARGLVRPEHHGRMGMLRLRTRGRRTGRERAVILGYFRDGDDFVTLAMNGWAESAPAWWLNLRADPAAEADTVDGVVRVRGREATGAERDRLWAEFPRYKGWGGADFESHAASRSHDTPVVVLERV
ncbi:nitroreductase/quinone reductase family protein [Nocardia rhamnosiphila]|uniref:Nitroreductase/quinone reductase family protein n=1 Tax=Nocardia rhamnosiphila TaxID=426716 RepID=A0ABV2WM55_9NOCA